MNIESRSPSAPDATPAFAPVRGKDRIDVLDVLRGIAILGIFYMNIPFMAGPTFATLSDPAAMGWSPADQATWLLLHTTWEGTQRGMLEMLFGAGLMVTAAKAMEPSGPVGVADLYIRRNLWLVAFGLFDVFALLWPGDILHIYGLAALALFPFRRLGMKALVGCGLAFALFVGAIGTVDYVQRPAELERYERARADIAAGTAIEADDRKLVERFDRVLERRVTEEPEVAKRVAEESEARAGSFGDYAGFLISAFMVIVGEGSLLFGVIEAFCVMLLGIAAWKIGFIQGRLTLRQYLVAALAAYAFGLTARYVGGIERIAYDVEPKTGWITPELARIAVTVGHIALINLLCKIPSTMKLLSPFKAAGRMAFTLYFMQQIIGLYIMFNPAALALPGGQGWAHLALQATIVVAILLVFANFWLRFFASGPLEWFWRSLSYWQRQPFRRAPPSEPWPGTRPA